MSPDRHSLPFSRNAEQAALPFSLTRSAAFSTSATMAVALSDCGGDSCAAADVTYVRQMNTVEASRQATCLFIAFPPRIAVEQTRPKHSESGSRRIVSQVARRGNTD